MLGMKEVEWVEIIWYWERRTTRGLKILHDVMLNNLHSPNTYYVGNQTKDKVMKSEW